MQAIALVVDPATLASSAPGRTRRVRDEEIDAPQARAAADHSQEIPHVDLDRPVPEIALVGIAGVAVVIERERDLEPRAAEAFGHAARAAEKFEDVHQSELPPPPSNPPPPPL